MYLRKKGKEYSWFIHSYVNKLGERRVMGVCPELSSASASYGSADKGLDNQTIRRALVKAINSPNSYNYWDLYQKTLI